ncbi:MAG: hypothetical protein ACEQSE_09330 [Candidatus Aquirickettsiella gammari]
MDISSLKLRKPQFSAKICPIFWEPISGTSERITALIGLLPHADSATYFPPAAHCILPLQRLKSMMGNTRGGSAFGILMESAQFITQQLSCGAELEDISAPFSGFTVGASRIVRGYSEQQLLDAAIRMVSTFGSHEEILDEGGDIRAISANTRDFIKKVKTQYAGDVANRKERFHLKTFADGLAKVTIDFQYEKWLVQFASLPATTYQQPYSLREAESKLFEILTAKTTINAPVSPLLIINSKALSHSEKDSRILAKSALDHFKGLASTHNIEVFSASNEGLAVQKLEEISR